MVVVVVMVKREDGGKEEREKSVGNPERGKGHRSH